ncbi:M23 family metallopeptidase [Nocardia sp. CA-119907]|uniref:M23 family metallopeptidase n=1 Tax=Nocardia sp. CA-119907 TaxID=3239973 RepID=UPI003D95B07D
MWAADYGSAPDAWYADPAITHNTWDTHSGNTPDAWYPDPANTHNTWDTHSGNTPDAWYPDPANTHNARDTHSGNTPDAWYPDPANTHNTWDTDPGNTHNTWSNRNDGNAWEGDARATVERADIPAAPTNRPVRGKRRSGAHRLPAPPNGLRGRAAVIAVAAGAIVAAGQNLATPAKAPATAELQAVGQQRAVAPFSADLPTAPELLDIATPMDLDQYGDMLQHGSKFAEEMAAAADAKLRPLFTKFTSGTFTSGFGQRWGVLHGGVDIAAPIGTPIYAVEDGTVIDAGPAAGFGMWVRVRGDDGTVTVYGHINTAVVSVGEHVLAGDEIATVGNRGESTGPHCHFEVWLNGTDRIDPVPWLATRGISLGTERD